MHEQVTLPTFSRLQYTHIHFSSIGSLTFRVGRPHTPAKDVL